MEISFSIFFKYSDETLVTIFETIKSRSIGIDIDSIIATEQYSFEKGIDLMNLSSKNYLFSKNITIKDSSEKNTMMFFVKRKEVLVLSFKFESEKKYLENEKLILSKLILDNKDFLFANADDYDFVLREDESDIVTHELLFGPVPEFKIQKDDDGDDYINMEHCYGRTHYLFGVGLRVGWRMFFGKEFYQKLEIKQSLEKYNKAKNNKIFGEVIYIEMYNSAHDYNESQNYVLLKDFREEISFDIVISKFENS
jgi:hypothetical protein